MEGAINRLLIDHIEEIEQIYNLKLERRRIRDHQNVFDMPNYYFKKTFRFDKDMTWEIINMISPFIEQGTYTNKISNELKVLTALSFFATGSTQTNLGDSFVLGLSQSMVSRSIKEVSNIMTAHLAPHHIQFPSTANELNIIKEGFFLKHNVGGVIGCIDCTHIAIMAPAETDEDHPPIVYYNRKGFHSLNVQLICDVDTKILAANSRFPGSVHDSAIWATSTIRASVVRMFREHNNIWLIGDSGYPIEPWLLTPIVNAQPGTPEARYTLGHRRIRNVIERCNGLLKMRFRCLSKKLLYHPIRAGKIVYSCAVLHNLAIDFNLEEPDEDDLIIEDDDDDDDHVANVNNNNELLNEGRRIRANFIRRYF